MRKGFTDALVADVLLAFDVRLHSLLYVVNVHESAAVLADFLAALAQERVCFAKLFFFFFCVELSLLFFL